MRFSLVALFALGLAAPASAQDQPSQGSPQTSAPRRSPDFLFGRPGGSFAVRGGWLFSRAGSDWYDFVTDQLTLKHGDFNAPGIGSDVGITMSDRVDAVIGVDYARSSATSEYRHFVDNNRQPINQSTRLHTTDITGSVRVALADRGRRVSTLAWVPRGTTPYVGAGGGMMYYKLMQAGDFVDALDPRLPVFSDVFRSEGWTPTAHVFGGVDVRVARRLFVTFEGRYRWAAGELTQQWVDFDPIDLSGLRLSAGINVPF